MDEMTQQNAALVEEAAAASESLLVQSASLADAVSMFKIDDQHRVATTRAVAQRSLHKSCSSRQQVPNAYGKTKCSRR
ncbi:MAG: hypothetical protein U5L01_01465 [Rheinheimera sp.]|nr:hypothetical protein [Rheinheimera sp.]